MGVGIQTLVERAKDALQDFKKIEKQTCDLKSSKQVGNSLREVEALLRASAARLTEEGTEGIPVNITSLADKLGAVNRRVKGIVRNERGKLLWALLEKLRRQVLYFKRKALMEELLVVVSRTEETARAFKASVDVECDLWQEAYRKACKEREEERERQRREEEERVRQEEEQARQEEEWRRQQVLQQLQQQKQQMLQQKEQEQRQKEQEQQYDVIRQRDQDKPLMHSQLTKEQRKLLKEQEAEFIKNIDRIMVHLELLKKKLGLAYPEQAFIEDYQSSDTLRMVLEYRKALAAFWDKFERAHNAERVIDDAWWETAAAYRWVQRGRDYRLLVEPLDIVYYYSQGNHLGARGGHYAEGYFDGHQQGAAGGGGGDGWPHDNGRRPARYVLLERQERRVLLAGGGSAESSLLKAKLLEEAGGDARKLPSLPPLPVYEDEDEDEDSDGDGGDEEGGAVAAPLAGKRSRDGGEDEPGGQGGEGEGPEPPRRRSGALRALQAAAVACAAAAALAGVAARRRRQATAGKP